MRERLNMVDIDVCQGYKFIRGILGKLGTIDYSSFSLSDAPDDESVPILSEEIAGYKPNIKRKSKRRKSKKRKSKRRKKKTRRRSR